MQTTETHTAKNQIAGQQPFIPDALKFFDSLPDSSYVRQPVVEALFACSSATVWRGVNAGRIPKPRKLSPRTTAWNVGELREVLGLFKQSFQELNEERKQK